MTIEDILKTPVYLMSTTGHWTLSSYESLYALIERNKDEWYLLEPADEGNLNILQGYLLIRGMDINFVKKYRRGMFKDYVYKIGDL